MCETCGVSKDEFEEASRLAHRSCVASMYEQAGVDPAIYGYPRPPRNEVLTANDQITTYHRAHPGKPMTGEEFREWCANWMNEKYGMTREDFDRKMAEVEQRRLATEAAAGS